MMKNKPGHNHTKTWEYRYDCVACTSHEQFIYDENEKIKQGGLK